MVVKQLCDFKDDVCQGRCVVGHRSLANLRRRWNVISGPTAFPGPYFGSASVPSARLTAICKHDRVAAVDRPDQDFHGVLRWLLGALGFRQRHDVLCRLP
jgi:hypothetical protein